MGGIIIIAATVIPTLLFARLENIYVILVLIATLWMGTVGFLDDYIKTFRKNKEGLAGWFKVAGQIGLGIIVGAMLYFHDDVVVREFDQDFVGTITDVGDVVNDLPPGAYEDCTRHQNDHSLRQEQRSRLQELCLVRHLRSR